MHLMADNPSAGGGPHPPQEITCVLVEDQGLFLEMLRGMISMRGGLRIVASALSVAEGRAVVDKHQPDLLLLDLDLPDGSGLEVAQRLLEKNPEARVVVVSGHAAAFVCPPWLRENLQAVISKNDTFAALRGELDEILSPTRTKLRPRTGKNITTKDLSAREAEIFALIGEGLTSKEIGTRLHLSEHTIQAHRKRIAFKLGTTGSELSHRAIAQRTAFFGSPATAE
jgi:DNA-binding NarL/FixJ family response regulator